MKRQKCVIVSMLLIAVGLGGLILAEDGLTNKVCVPCSTDIPSLHGSEIVELLNQLSSGWSVIQEHHLERTFYFDNFADALAFTNRVGELAEEEGHHPDIYLSWGKVVIQIWTHKIDGLSENDFILASKIGN